MRRIRLRDRWRAAWRLVKSRRALRLLVPILGAVPMAAVFEAAGLVKKVEEPVTRMLAHQVVPKKSNVAVVRITDQDFENPNLFAGKHPLAPCKVQEIVEAIAALRPKAIGVDLDTSDPAYRVVGEGKCADAGGKAGAAGGVPVVWARRVNHSHLTATIYAEDVLGGAGKPESAVAEVSTDGDGIVRKYARRFETDRGRLLLLPIALRAAAGLPGSSDPEGERLIYFYGHTSGPQRLHMSAGEVLQAKGDPAIACEFKDKVVLLGGDFQGIDEHPTPLGWMRGVELLAHIAESDPKNPPPAAPMLEQAIILLGACLIAVCFDVLNARRVAAALSGMAIGLLAAWWYTHLTRDAILVGIVFVVIICQQVYTKLKRAYQEESEKVRKAAEAQGGAEQ